MRAYLSLVTDASADAQIFECWLVPPNTVESLGYCFRALVSPPQTPRPFPTPPHYETRKGLVRRFHVGLREHPARPAVRADVDRRLMDRRRPLVRGGRLVHEGRGHHPRRGSGIRGGGQQEAAGGAGERRDSAVRGMIDRGCIPRRGNRPEGWLELTRKSSGANAGISARP